MLQLRKGAIAQMQQNLGLWAGVALGVLIFGGWFGMLAMGVSKTVGPFSDPVRYQWVADGERQCAILHKSGAMERCEHYFPAELNRFRLEYTCPDALVVLGSNPRRCKAFTG